eukprot:3337200-Pyramimonas_sp.AAC.1
MFIPARQEWRCRNCNVSATTEYTLKGLRTGASKLCQPDEIQAWRAREFFSQHESSPGDPSVQ